MEFDVSAAVESLKKANQGRLEVSDFYIARLNEIFTQTTQALNFSNRWLKMDEEKRKSFNRQMRKALNSLDNANKILEEL